MKNRENYPSEALLPGTVIRSIRFDRLGVITDAFEDDGIIFYTCFLMPNTSSKGSLNIKNNHYASKSGLDGILVEESEFDIISYLMIGRVNLDNVEFFHPTRDLML
tara:strand:+ start:3006 stop:3323 length:318 start_codon:yes stop_codon:yes gene_type:complete